MVTQTGGSRKRDKLLPVSILVMAEEEAAPTLAKDEKEILGLIALQLWLEILQRLLDGQMRPMIWVELQQPSPKIIAVRQTS